MAKNLLVVALFPKKPCSECYIYSVENMWREECRGSIILNGLAPLKLCLYFLHPII